MDVSITNLCFIAYWNAATDNATFMGA
jgi:hypothetical protein